MQSLGERLTQARKAKGLTQEQLAEAMHCSRQAISHWETGRSQPDVDTLAHLTALLECDLLHNAPTPPPPQTETDLPLQKPEASPSSPAQKPLNWRYPVCFVMGALLMLLVVLPLIPQAKPTAANTASIELYDKAWFSNVAQPVPGQAYLTIYTDVEPIPLVEHADFSEKIGWLFEIHLAETGGVDITVTEIAYDFLRYEKLKRKPEFKWAGDQLAEIFSSEPLISAGTETVLGVGLPEQDLIGIGVYVRGTDANGNELEFRDFFPFSTELAE